MLQNSEIYPAFVFAEKTERNELWCDLYRQGLTATEIGARFGVTRERVCQILRKGNLIEHRLQRKRLAAEMMEQDKATVKVAKEAIDAQLLDLVRKGLSIAGAASQVGLTTQQATYVCKIHGVVSAHGRWHDFSARKARIEQLVTEGKSLNAAMKIAGDEEGRKISYVWVWRNCPALCTKHRRKPVAEPSKHPAVYSAPVVSAPVEREIWSAELVQQLLKLWFGGASAQQISDILGKPFTRNAILGKIYRLRIDGELKISHSAAV